MRISVFVISAYVVLSSLVHAANDRMEAVYFEQTGHWYGVVPIPANITWQECVDSCITLGGYLATATSEEENSFIAGLLGEHVTFLGGAQEDNEGAWFWITGEPWAFDAWGPGEPNEAFDGEDFVALKAEDSLWNDSRNWFVPDEVFVVEWETPHCCSLRGDVNGNGSGPVISDLVYLASYMFQEGPEPPCTEEADINGDASGPDIADLVYLVTYMFQDGPSPAECP